MNRQIFLDTETTGFDFKIGNRIIEFGGIEVIDRKITGNNLHFYCNPNYEVEAGALAVHGLTNEFLSDKPLFEEKVDEMMEFLKDAEIIIHNAAFDVPFLNWELNLVKNNKWNSIESNVSKIIDSLEVARKKHPLQKNNLDALCKRYDIKNDHRTYHGALLDAQLLADMYLVMTGGQTNFKLSMANDDSLNNQIIDNIKSIKLNKMKISSQKIKTHDDYLKNILNLSGNDLW